MTEFFENPSDILKKKTAVIFKTMDIKMIVLKEWGNAKQKHRSLIVLSDLQVVLGHAKLSERMTVTVR